MSTFQILITHYTADYKLFVKRKAGPSLCNYERLESVRAIWKKLV